ncbi:hypothetical protein P2H44_22780 [Albimonas sp. CAU 1670]|uniref:hypothetical protein n=1 Tax=Albimonas sp. CAU 1670 TaxID=3032599 RepID=UPI0023D9B71B|nr:hypothetical protein [Albimonas sp. CAU 1670]MDF2235391.1 hypothetical protein [Albimonas sp. CAU 1670]
MDAARSPVVAFGLAAAARALAAKQRPLTREEMGELRLRRVRWMPGRDDVAEALAAFLAAAQDDDPATREAAAARFLADLAVLEDGVPLAEAHAHRVEATVARIETEWGQGAFDWQERADLR